VVSTAVERDRRVELAEVPSAKWGWSRINHRTWHITGLVVAVFLVAMMVAVLRATGRPVKRRVSE
jgi:Protein of unknown function (DUF2631)